MFFETGLSGEVFRPNFVTKQLLKHDLKSQTNIHKHSELLEKATTFLFGVAMATLKRPHLHRIHGGFGGREDGHLQTHHCGGGEASAHRATAAQVVERPALKMTSPVEKKSKKEPPKSCRLGGENEVYANNYLLQVQLCRRLDDHRPKKMVHIHNIKKMFWCWKPEIKLCI